VLPWDDAFEVEVLDRGSRMPSDAELEHLYSLYQNVHERGLAINTFDLPRTLFGDMLAHDCWELIVLRLPGQPACPPVAFGAHFIGPSHYAPMIVGLDYQYVRSHHSYRQALRQALLRARVHGSQRILLGIGASLEKRRFGATAQARCAYVQAADHYNQQVLDLIAAEALAHA
jgi:hypothetical protein